MSAVVFNITDLGSGQGYTIQQVSSGAFLSINGSSIVVTQAPSMFNVFSVTKSTDSGTGFL